MAIVEMLWVCCREKWLGKDERIVGIQMVAAEKLGKEEG